MTATDTLRDDLLNIVSGLLHDRGHQVDAWPTDEAAAYRMHGGFADGARAVKKVRMEKALADLLVVVQPAIRDAWDEGLDAGITAMENGGPAEPNPYERNTP